MQNAFVLDKNKKPLMPCHPAHARKLLKQGRAAVFRLHPFTIILKDRTVEDSAVQDVIIKIHPGSKKSGLAVVRINGNDRLSAVSLIELLHRGDRIRQALYVRRCLRRGRRYRKLRYRTPRFSNRIRSKGWLPPSLRHRVDSIINWLKKLQKLVPVSNITVSLHSFRSAIVPTAEPVKHVGPTDSGYSIAKAFLMEQFGKKCFYCGRTFKELTIDHVVPRVKGGSNRLSNLVLACAKCNQVKGTRSIEEFLKGQPETLAILKRRMQEPLKDIAAVNSSRLELLRQLCDLGLGINASTSVVTALNRAKLGYLKTPCLEALCAGNVDLLTKMTLPDVLVVRCIGRGLYQRAITDKQGFPRAHRMRTKRVFGFATGDTVRAVNSKGKFPGTHIGRIVVRKNGCFDVHTKNRKILSNWKNCSKLACYDGYGYQFARVGSL